MTSTMLQGNSKEPRTYWVEDIAIILGIGRTSAYKLARAHWFLDSYIPQFIQCLAGISGF